MALRKDVTASVWSSQGCQNLCKPGSDSDFNVFDEHQISNHLDPEMLEVLPELDKFLNQEQRLDQTQEESL